jgi:hypothetical protein
LGNLVDTIEESDVTMTAALQDKMIASKATGSKFTSSIEHTKAKEHKGRGGGAKKRSSSDDALSSTAPPANPAQQMFAPSNKSPLSSMTTVKRQKQAHPGNNEHIHWTKLTLCEFCNHGVQSKVLQLRCVFEP